MGSSLTQQDAARIMFAYAKSIRAAERCVEEVFAEKTTRKVRLRLIAEDKAAEREFTDLIATRVEPES